MGGSLENNNIQRLGAGGILESEGGTVYQAGGTIESGGGTVYPGPEAGNQELLYVKAG